MIKISDVDEVIQEIKSKRDHTSSDCIKLAAYITIRNELEQAENLIKQEPTYSFSEPKDIIHIDSTSEFAQKINGKSINDVIPMIDEIMQTVKLINPRLYDVAINKF